MCLIIFSWKPDTENPLLVVANRDEFYARPTLKAHYWEDYPDIFAGRDLKAGGSWLGVNRSGRIAAITNVREWPFEAGELSRGELVCSFLESQQHPLDYLAEVQGKGEQYAGFNLLIGDTRGLYYFSNRSEGIKTLKPGVFGLCNYQLNTPWPKLLKTRKAISGLLDKKNNAQVEALMAVMQDQQHAPDNALPDTGIGLERERLLSSPFIASKDYGTRNTSVLQFSSDGHLKWSEQTYVGNGILDELTDFSISFL